MKLSEATKMNWKLPANVAIAISAACSSFAGNVTSTFDGGGQRIGSANYVMDCSVEELAGLASSGNYTLFAGYIAQVADEEETGPVNQGPQVSIASVAPITLPVNSVNLNATVTDDGLPSGVLSILWSPIAGVGTVTFGNASAASTTANFSTNGTYTLRLVASDGALATTGFVTVVVNAHSSSVPPPVITNAVAEIGGIPVVVPNKPFIFSAAATDAAGNPLGYSWNFGDGTTGVGYQPTHVFSNCGPHTVTYVITGGMAPVTNTLLVAVACPFEVRPKPLSLLMSVNFATNKSELATLRGTFAVPPGFYPSNRWATVAVGGVSRDFWMAGKKPGTSGLSRLTLSFKNFKTKSGVVTNTIGTLSATLKGDWNAAWADDGLINATTNLTINVPVWLLLDSDPPESFFAEKQLLYKAKFGKTGSAK